MDDVDAAFAAFVADRRPALLRTALLLTGDRAPAEELVQRALGRARRSRRGDPGDAALQRLVAGATSRWARLTRAEQVIETLPEPSTDHGSARAEPDLGTALRELPPRTRAVVVLRWHDRLPDHRIAELLRCPEATVAAEADRGLAQLRPAITPSAYERATAERPDGERLAEQLTRLVEQPGRWRLTPAESVDDLGVRRSGTRRRVAVGAVAAAAAVAITVPLARWAPDPAAGSAAPAPSVVATSPAPDAGRGVPVLAGPTRGSLARDTAFLAAALQVGWGAQVPPPLGQREVVFAADTPHGRIALVVGTALEDFRGVWLTGPVGAAAADLVPHLPSRLGQQRPLTVLLGGPGDATLVVVAAPGDEIAVSDRLMTGPRGTVGRRYAPVAADDGVAVLPARTTSLGPALSVRVSREGREVYRSAVDWLGDRSPTPAPGPGLSRLRAGQGSPDPIVVDAALADLARPLGVEPEALQPLLLWSAELDLGRRSGGVAVLVGYSPGGALVVTTWARAGGGAVTCGTQTPPGSTDVAGLNIARVCDVALPGLGQTNGGRWLVVTAPAAAASAELLDSRGRVLRPLDLVDGSTVVNLPDGASTVRTLDAGGRLLRETPIAPSPTEPFGDFGPGPAR